MIVVMNKWDKIAEVAKNKQDEMEYRQLYEIEVRNVLDKTLGNELYSKTGANNVEVVPCALVSHTQFGDSLARQLIQSTALSLSRH